MARTGRSRVVFFLIRRERKVKGFLAAMCLGVMAFASQASAAEPAKIHIGICTGTVSQSEDDLRGAEALIKKYGDVANGGMIKHITYPDNFMTEMETTISQIVSFADDPDMKAIIVNHGCIPACPRASPRHYALLRRSS